MFSLFFSGLTLLAPTYKMKCDTYASSRTQCVVAALLPLAISVVLRLVPKVLQAATSLLVVVLVEVLQAATLMLAEVLQAVTSMLVAALQAAGARLGVVGCRRISSRTSLTLMRTSRPREAGRMESRRATTSLCACRITMVTLPTITAEAIAIAGAILLEVAAVVPGEVTPY